MAGFRNLREFVMELKKAVKEIITEPVVLVILLSGLFFLIFVSLVSFL